MGDWSLRKTSSKLPRSLSAPWDWSALSESILHTSYRVLPTDAQLPAVLLVAKPSHPGLTGRWDLTVPGLSGWGWARRFGGKLTFLLQSNLSKDVMTGSSSMGTMLSNEGKRAVEGDGAPGE